MSGDWIKMRCNLWDDPRVAKIVDLTDSSEAAVVGALYWLWAAADQHTEDGIMHGLTCKAIDRKTGVPGFADALIVIGWIADYPEGIRIVDFEKHNGTSAKKRCQTAKRVANHAANASIAKVVAITNAPSVSTALPREEKRREDIEIQEGKPSLSSAVPTEDQKPTDLPKKQAEIPDCPHQKLIGLYQKHLPHLAQPRVWEGTRQKHLQSRWRQCAAESAYSEGYDSEAGGLKFWESLFSYIASDTTLATGFEGNGRSWRPDLPWIVKPENFQKIVDGKYELQKTGTRRAI